MSCLLPSGKNGVSKYRSMPNLRGKPDRHCGHIFSSCRNAKRVVKVQVICIQIRCILYWLTSYSFFFEGELVSGIYSLQLNLYELVSNNSKLDMIFLWFTADTAAAMTLQLLPLFLDKKKKDGTAYLLCIVEVHFLWIICKTYAMLD